MRTVVLLVCLLAIGNVFADLYLQSPPGCNDRLNEAGQNRDNAQRVFDSQNNAKGGYCWGLTPMTYYAGSILPIEWTNQHSCGSSKASCNLVIQYMCGYNDGPANVRIRDGSTTGTIQDDPAQYNKQDANGNYVFGMQESYDYYQQCKGRTRNKGLFTSNQNLNTNDARATRQNNGATQYGFECTEERDYYPYWAPSPWKDIAILTDDTKHMCPYYKAQSQNVVGRWSCSGSTSAQQPIDQSACTSTGGTWSQTAAWGIPAPDCLPAPWNRDNHLGNGLNGATNSYNWTVPTSATEGCVVGDKCVCVLRMRYNITTAEIDGFGMDDGTFTDFTANSKPPISTDPTVTVSGNNFTLAVNTAQFGRTFQDRTYTFYIASRPKGISDSAKIYNLNVRGKRGNIVQTFPATEYDFVPETLVATTGDYVHFQWTGCDTNPQGNDGEGRDQTDRTNIVQIADVAYNRPLSDSDISSGNTPLLFSDANTRSNMALIGQTGCLTYQQLLDKNGGNAGALEDDVQNCAKLNAAPSPYFNGGLVKMSTQGTFHYMSTRNNNFSNRSQKGSIIINPLIPAWGVALIVIGAVAVASVAAATGGWVWSKKHPHGRIASAYGTAGEKFSNLMRRVRRG